MCYTNIIAMIDLIISEKARVEKKNLFANTTVLVEMVQVSSPVDLA